MKKQQIKNMVIDFLLSKNAYAMICKAWLGKDENGFKACYRNADRQITEVWLGTNNKQEAIQRLMLGA